MPSTNLQTKTGSLDFAAARSHMIESQLRPNKVRDERILTAMETLPREIFVPPSMTGIAYIDEDVQVAPGRFLLEPMVLARLLEEAVIASGDNVLDIAPATGYSTAVLASMVSRVTALEGDTALKAQTSSNLVSLKIANADVQFGALAAGWKANGPYNVILINGSIEVLPEALTSQLAEGGRLVAVVRQFGTHHAAHTGEARLYEKIKGAISHRLLFDANVKLLTDFKAPAKFTF